VNQAQLAEKETEHRSPRAPAAAISRRSDTYRLKDATIFVTTDRVAKPKKIEFWTDRNYLIARDKAYDVTVRLALGEMEDEAWLR
jgi:hypothetical protein